MAEYRLMNLKQQKLVTKAARPSLDKFVSRNPKMPSRNFCTYLINFGTQEISKSRLVKGAATDASASDKEMPTSAAFKAPQSFAPSPQKPQQ